MAVIGGGPVGLFATFYAGLRGLSVTLVDSLHELGGQLVSLYPNQVLYDVPGFAGATAAEVAERLISQAELARPQVRLGTDVHQIGLSANGFTLNTSGGTIEARAVVVAAGVGPLTPKTLVVQGADRFQGRGLHSHLPVGLDIFRGRHTVLVGSGEVIVYHATRLADAGATVTIVPRRGHLKLSAQSREDLQTRVINTSEFGEVVALEGQEHVERVILRDTRDGSLREVAADQVIACLGFDASLSVLSQWQLDLSSTGIRVDAAMRTSRAGIYAIGDVCSYPGKLKLIATGFAEAATAINHLATRLDPQANYFPGHSTSVAPRRLAGLRHPTASSS